MSATPDSERDSGSKKTRMQSMKQNLNLQQVVGRYRLNMFYHGRSNVEASKHLHWGYSSSFSPRREKGSPPGLLAEKWSIHVINSICPVEAWYFSFLAWSSSNIRLISSQASMAPATLYSSISYSTKWSVGGKTLFQKTLFCPIWGHGNIFRRFRYSPVEYGGQWSDLLEINHSRLFGTLIGCILWSNWVIRKICR